MTEKIYPLFRDSVAQSATAKIDGVDAGRFLAVALPFGSTTVNNRAFTFDLQTAAWSEWTGMRVGAFCMNNKVVSGDTLFYGDADSGKVYLYGRQTGSTFDFEYVSPFFDGGDESVEKNVIRFNVTAAFDHSDSIEVAFYVNHDLATKVYADTIVSDRPAKRLKAYSGHCSGAVRGNVFAIGVKSLSTDTLTLAGIEMFTTAARRIEP